MVSIAVLAGGPSSEHDVSLQTGSEILRCLRAGRHAARPLRIARDGTWCEGGPGSSFADLDGRPGVPIRTALAHVAQEREVAFVALHGRFGEDGQVQGLLEAAGVAYTGSPPAASRLGMDKARSKQVARAVGAACAPHAVVGADEAAPERLLREVGLPCFVKPVCGGSSVGVTLAREARDLGPGLSRAQAEDPRGRALVERLVEGEELTCSVLRVEGELRCLPLVAIRPAAGSAFYDYRAKYESEHTRYQCPAPVPAGVADDVRRVCLALYERLGLRGCARVDFIHDRPRERAVFLELNTVPGFTSHSLVPLAAERSGLGRLALLEAVLADAGPPRP